VVVPYQNPQVARPGCGVGACACAAGYGDDDGVKEQPNTQESFTFIFLIIFFFFSHSGLVTMVVAHTANQIAYDVQNVSSSSLHNYANQ
jgi:hypothetical protein